MKKLKLIYWLICLVLIGLLDSCDNEIIEGEFQETFPCTEKAEIGEMRAILDTLDFELDFRGEMSKTKAEIVIHQNGFYHMNIYTTHEEYGIIYLGINYPGIGIFDLETSNEGGFIFAGNNHTGLTNFGVYAQIGVEAFFFENYSTFDDYGGFGELEVTAIDFEQRMISGNFSFKAARSKKDSVTGEVILNENGNPIIEVVEITCGYFNEIIFEPKDESDQPFYLTEFYAEVEGKEFVENSVNAQIRIIGINEFEVVNIEAVTLSGKVLRIDIPLDLEEGTYPFESISDGTKLTAIYNDNNGSEALTANPGTITITDFDKIRGFIEADFSFTATDPFNVDPTIIEITNGSLKQSFEIASSSNYLTAEVDGLEYVAKFISLPESNIFGVNVVTIDSKAVDDRGLDLIIPTDIEVGSYNMTKYFVSGNEIVGLYSPEVEVVNSHRSESGTLTIVSNNIATGEIEGIFNFVATDVFEQETSEYVITNGVFLIQLYD